MLQLSFDGPIARLRLNRPAARNALAMADWEALTARVEAVAAAGSRVLIVSGAGGVFCAGADLDEIAAVQADPAARARFRTVMRAALDRLRDLPLATIAMVEGPCYGAGVALAMACDLRVADPGARFACPPARIGIGYPQEDVHRLVTLVGPGQAARLLLTGSPIDADEALRIGLVEELGGEDRLGALVEAVLACDPASIAALKHAVALAGSGVRSDAGGDATFDALLGSPEVAERLSRRRGRRTLPPPAA